MRKPWMGLTALAAALTAVAPAAAETVRIRGHIQTVALPVLTVLTREGAPVTIRLASDFKATAVVKASVADIKPGTFIGTAAMPQPDGTLKALAISIFPEALRGAGEGHRDFDLAPGSTMTNATVDGTISGGAGQGFHLSYKGGEKTLDVPPGTPVITTAPATAADVKPDVGVMIFAAERQPDGSFTAGRILVGKDGVDPPM